MTALVEHVNGTIPAVSSSPWTTGTAPAVPEADAPKRPQVRELTGGLKAAVNAVGIAVAALGGLGFVNSFHRVDTAAQTSFGHLAFTVPVGVDLGILVFSALDIVLAVLDMRLWWLRFIPWTLTVATIYLNVADQPGQAPLTAFDRLAHGLLPCLWVLSIEVGAHVVRKRAGLLSERRMDKIRLSRWVLAPFTTASLRRRMVLWEERSYKVALDREKARLLAKTGLQDRYGAILWRWKAPRRDRALYRLGELAPAPDAGARPSATDARTGPGTGEQTVPADTAVRPRTARRPSATGKQTGPTGKRGPSATRSRTARPDRTEDISDLIPAAEQFADQLAAQQQPLTRASLLAALRATGATVSNERAGALLTHLRTRAEQADTPNDMPSDLDDTTEVEVA